MVRALHSSVPDLDDAFPHLALDLIIVSKSESTTATILFSAILLVVRRNGANVSTSLPIRRND